MSEEKVQELQEFVNDFNKKIKEACDIYTKKQNKIKTLKKNHSVNDFNKDKEDKLPDISKNFKTIEKIKIRKNLSINNIIVSTPIWKPSNGYPDYFEKFKRLQDKHEINDWEKVCNIYILIIFFCYIFYLQGRASLCKRSYEKEINLPQKKNFVCRKLFGDNIRQYPNIKQSKKASTIDLGKMGKRIILKYIKNNEEKEKIIEEKKDYIYKYLHSKPPVKYNPWKFSNHVIEEFCRTPVDKVYSFSHLMEPTPKYMTKPFRRPKIYGDYFDNNI